MLWSRLYELCGDPWTDDPDEVKNERMIFEQAIKDKDVETINEYIGFIRENRDYVCESDEVELIGQYDKLIEDIEEAIK